MMMILLYAPQQRHVRLFLVFSLLLLQIALSFVVLQPFPSARSITTTSHTRLFALPNVTEMKASDIRKELESYGISTKSFLEKKELVEALEKARLEGKKPKSDAKSAEEPKTTKTTATDTNTGSATKGRPERIQEEMAKANAMKVGDLKKELESRGISTKSFFEKSEFVRAYAEAVVDSVQKGATSTGTRNGAKQPVQDEPYDSSYRDVAVQKLDPRQLSGMVIDVKLR